ncbi:MAG: PBSX family phage terminase large subunit [Paludibacteraceae bacterium]|nr:PBSX family phage terminase large subunit [Paludibacteraceae bacterium]
MIELTLSRRLFTPKALPYITDYGHRWELWYGGSGSSKSYSITQKLIIRACREPIKIVVCRRYGTTIRNTVFSLFKDILKKWKLTPYIKVRESDFNITFPNGSEIIFLGLDEETKLLSLNNISTVWVEEAYEVPQAIVEQLNLRMRGKAANQQIILSWNPISKSHWLYNFTQNPPENSAIIHLTFKDNPFISPEYAAAMEDLLKRNPQRARVFYYGEWGVDSEGLVFTNWREEEFDVQQLAASGAELKCGIDFGFVDATAIVCSLYDAKTHTIYIYDEWLQTGAQLDKIVAQLADKRLKHTPIWCDSAEPRSIDFLRNAGYNAKPCIKGADSVNARIAFLQNNTIIIHPRCRKLTEEFENFSYIKDKEGNWTDKTTHEWSHGIDALGYSYSNIYKSNRLMSISKVGLGI